jgi:hypothetical protein
MLVRHLIEMLEEFPPDMIIHVQTSAGATEVVVRRVDCEIRIQDR